MRGTSPSYSEVSSLRLCSGTVLEKDRPNDAWGSGLVLVGALGGFGLDPYRGRPCLPVDPQSSARADLPI